MQTNRPIRRRVTQPTQGPLPHGVQTHEGGRAEIQTAEVELTRAVATCLLFEDTFYESGDSIANRIAKLCREVPMAKIADLAKRARTDLKLRHVPLWLLVQMVHMYKEHRNVPPTVGLRLAYQPRLISDTIADVIQRPDEMPELVSLFWKSIHRKKAPLPIQMKKGLAQAFRKFGFYKLAKWNRDREITLRDVMFMAHPKPLLKPNEQEIFSVLTIKGRDVTRHSDGQAEIWRKLADKQLEAPGTWENRLSAGEDKGATFTDLLQQRKLGDMAILMNLRNMMEGGVDRNLIRTVLLERAEKSKVLPFRYVSAAKACPQMASILDEVLPKAVKGSLPGDTAVVVDISGSMDASISGKSQLLRWEAGASLAILVQYLVQYSRIFTFSYDLHELMNVRGLGVLEQMRQLYHGGTELGRCLEKLRREWPNPHRIVVVTDEQVHDYLPYGWAPHCYIINVAPYKPGVEVDGNHWHRISGWSERVLDYMSFIETGKLIGVEEEEGA